MNPLTTKNRDVAVYLVRVLSLNPIYEADEILAARDRYLGRSRTDPRRESWELREQREAVQSQLDSAREQFWTANDDELQAALAGLDADEFSDLKLATDRLNAVSQVRAEFVVLPEHKKCDHELLVKLQEVVVAAPREASRLKQAYLLRAVADASLHGRSRRMIRLLRSKYPDVFALEAEWLESIRRSEPIRTDTPTEAELIE